MIVHVRSFSMNQPGGSTAAAAVAALALIVTALASLQGSSSHCGLMPRFMLVSFAVQAVSVTRWDHALPAEITEAQFGIVWSGTLTCRTGTCWFAAGASFTRGDTKSDDEKLQVLSTAALRMVILIAFAGAPVSHRPSKQISWLAGTGSTTQPGGSIDNANGRLAWFNGVAAVLDPGGQFLIIVEKYGKRIR